MSDKAKEISIRELAEKLYVYNDMEVKMTGRIARKKKRRGEDVLFEIRQADAEAASFKRWVRLNDLYEVNETSASRDVSLAGDLVDAIRRVTKKQEHDNAKQVITDDNKIKIKRDDEND